MVSICTLLVQLETVETLLPFLSDLDRAWLRCSSRFVNRNAELSLVLFQRDCLDVHYTLLWEEECLQLELEASWKIWFPESPELSD